MSGETPLTVTGNLTADPVLRYTSTGTAFATFTVASTARFLDQADAEWKDGDALFMRCTVWRQQAERAAQTLTKGSRVVVTGRLRQRTYEDDDGASRTVIELAADEVGPSLRYASVAITKTHRQPARTRRHDHRGDRQCGGREQGARLQLLRRQGRIVRPRAA